MKNNNWLDFWNNNKKINFQNKLKKGIKKARFYGLFLYLIKPLLKILKALKHRYLN